MIVGPVVEKPASSRIADHSRLRFRLILAAFFGAADKLPRQRRSRFRIIRARAGGLAGSEWVHSGSCIRVSG